MSQKKTNTQTTPATLTAFLTSPEMIQLVRDVAVVSKAEGAKLRATTSARLSPRLTQCKTALGSAKAESSKLRSITVTHLHSGLTRCKALLASAKAKVTQLQQPAVSPAVNYDTPTIMRKLGTAQFEAWQHLNGVIETPDTNIHVQAYNMDLY